MLIAVTILVIVLIICVTILVGAYMDNRHSIEKEKLEMLRKNPDIFKKMYENR